MDTHTKQIYAFGPFRLDTARHLLKRDGEVVPLTPKAFETLLLLVGRSGEVVGKDELMQKLWPDTFVEENSLTRNISVLRKVLGEGRNEHHYIVTVPGRGYRFVASVSEVPDERAQPMEQETRKPGSGQAVAETDERPAARDEEVAIAREPAGAEYRIGEIRRYNRGTILALATLVIVAIGIAFGLYKFVGQKQRLIIVSKTPPRPIPFTSYLGHEDQPDFSPDGNQIAFTWDGEYEGNVDIYVKLIGTGPPLRLTTNPAPDVSPTWSPDGRSIAFIRQSAGSAGIYSIPALGGPERKVVDLYPGSVYIGRGIHYSPDGKFLAISDKRSAEDPLSIFLLSVETGEKRQITAPSAGSMGDLCPAFSPDGDTLAFTRYDTGGISELYLMPVAGGEPKRLTFDQENQSDLAWAPDGREIVYCLDLDFSLWRISTSGGTPERLAEGAQNASSLAISRQGARLAYSQTTFDTNIWKIDLQGSTNSGPSRVKLISSTLHDGAPQYSRDGQKIVFESARSGSYEIWMCDRDGSNLVQLTSLNTAATGTPRWSPDGLRVAFDSAAAGQWDIYVTSIEGGPPRRLTTTESSEFRPGWSRDGRWIYFPSNRSGEMQIWKMPTEGGEAVQVTRQGSGIEAFESPDGREVYYHKRSSRGGNIRRGSIFGNIQMGSIWRVTVEGEKEEQVLDQVPEGHWAIAEQGIYFLNPKVTPLAIEFYSFDTGRISRISTVEKEPVWENSGLAVSPDGRSILYVQLDHQGNDIMLVENFR